MPQMSPLMWSYLYLTFSTMLLLSMVKIYFYSNKMISVKTISSEIKINKSNWTW